MVTIKILLVSMCMCTDTFNTRADNLPGEIIHALEKGDVKIVSKYFSSSIELIFTESRGIYGKVQAEQILKNFFTKNGSGKFRYKHLHTPDVSNYIGELWTDGGLVYRIRIFMKNGQIHQMKIENKD